MNLHIGEQDDSSKKSVTETPKILFFFVDAIKKLGSTRT